MQIVRADVAAVLFDDAVGDAKSQSGTFTWVLRSKEWIEDAVRIAESGTVVAEAKLHAFALLRRGDGDSPTTNIT